MDDRDPRPNCSGRSQAIERAREIRAKVAADRERRHHMTRADEEMRARMRIVQFRIDARAARLQPPSGPAA
jgi:hypothetical protein